MEPFDFGIRHPEKISSLVRNTESVDSIAYNPDGTQLATIFFRNGIHLWNAQTGRLFRTFGGFSTGIESIVYSRDGKKLASGSNDKKVRIWDVKTGALLNTLTGPTDKIDSLAYSPDGSQIVSGSGDGTIRFWDPKTGACIGRLLLGENNTYLWCTRKSSETDWDCIRQDDGRLLVKEGPAGVLSSVVPSWWTKDGGEVTVDRPISISLREGEAAGFNLTLRNNSKRSAYWIRVVQDIIRDNNNNNPLLFYPPAPIPELKPGETVVLPVRASALLPQKITMEQIADLNLNIQTAQGTPKLFTIKARVQAPLPVLKKRELKTKTDGTSVFAVEIVNVGEIPLSTTKFHAQLINKSTASEFGHSIQLSSVTINSLAVGR